MAELSSALFSVGVIVVALGFAAHVGHAVMLANGRRVGRRPRRPAVARQPAYAGRRDRLVRDRRSDRAATGGPTLAASPSPLSRAATWLTVVGRRRPRAPRCSCAASSSAAGRGATCSSSRSRSRSRSLAGYLFLARRYPIRSIGFIPLGVALALLLYAS